MTSLILDDPFRLPRTTALRDAIDRWRRRQAAHRDRRLGEARFAALPAHLLADIGGVPPAGFPAPATRRPGDI